MNLWRGLKALVLMLPGMAMAQGQVDVEMSDALAAAREAWIRGDYDGIYEVITPEAEAGNPVAQNILGASYSQKDAGRGLPYDPAASLDWLRKAAEQEYTRAIYNLSLFWNEDHTGFGNDYARSLELAHQVAEMGYVPGYNLLGDIYTHGRGVEADAAKALEFYRKSADLGYSGGYREVGYAYYHGGGVEKNMALVHSYLQQAVALGDIKSLPDLAFLLEGNDGIGRDLLKSYLLYQRALAYRIPRAAYELAWFVEYDGYPGYWHDKVKGYGYCLLAIDWGYTISDGDITLECAKIAEGFTDKQIADARRFADGLK